MRLTFLIAGLLFCAAGCGQNLVTVSGKVTLNDKALANATVIFQPEGQGQGPGSHGKTNENGEYTLSLMTSDAKGAVPGKHKVSITLSAGDLDNSNTNLKAQKQVVPEEYNAKSKVFFEVPAGGTSAANFDLKSK